MRNLILVCVNMYVCHSALVIVAALKIIPKINDLNNHFILSNFCGSTIWSGPSWVFLLLVFPGATFVTVVCWQLNYSVARPKKTQFCMVSSSRKLAHASSYDSTRTQEERKATRFWWPDLGNHTTLPLSLISFM